jgi:hypothetical protein
MTDSNKGIMQDFKVFEVQYIFGSSVTFTEEKTTKQGGNSFSIEMSKDDKIDRSNPRVFHPYWTNINVA